MEIRWTGAASRARFAQMVHVAGRNPAAADKLDISIEGQINGLAVHPARGRVGRVAGTRELVVVGTPFIAVYRVRGNFVEILRFLHGAQRWPPGSGR